MGISVSERFLKQTRDISKAFEDQQLIADELIRMMRRTLKKIQTIYVKDLLSYVLNFKAMIVQRDTETIK